MRTPRLAAIAALLVAVPPAAAQICAPILPSSQPGLVVAGQICGPALLPPPVVWAAGNPAFPMVVPPLPGILPFSPILFVLGFAFPPVAILAPPLDPAFGLPGLVTSAPATSVVLTVVLPGPGPLLVPMPLPPTGGLVPAISVQAAYLTPPLLIGLTGATSITI